MIKETEYGAIIPHIRLPYEYSKIWVHPYKSAKKQDNLVMMMSKSFTLLSFVQVNYFQTIVAYIDPYKKQVSQTLMQRKLNPDKAELLEFQVKDWL